MKTRTTMQTRHPEARALRRPSRAPARRAPWFAAAAVAAAALAPSAVQAQDGAAPDAAPEPAVAEAHAAAIEALAGATRFLMANQNENGSFGVIPGASEAGEIGITALIVRGLALLPEKARTDGTQVALGRALTYLLAKQQHDGSFSPPGTGLATYRTALAINALVAVDATRHADAIARAQAYLAGTQFSEDHRLEKEGRQSPYYGGFGYKKGAADADLSNTHMALEALHESGLSEDSEVWKRAVVFLQRCQNRSESNDTPVDDVKVLDDGGFIYDPGLGRRYSPPIENPDGSVSIPSYASMTYAGLLSMVHAEVSKDDPRVQAAWDWIRRNYTLTENYGLGTRQNPRAAKQGLFYYYHVFAKTLDAWGQPSFASPEGGEEHHWARELSEHLAAIQREDGSWVNSEERWWENDPVLCTGYSLLALDLAFPWIEREAAPAPAPQGAGEEQGSRAGK